jgi:dTDP-4-dehydrorhamnose reductase
VFALDTVINTAAITDADGTVDADALLTAVEMGAFDIAESTFYVQAP